MEEPGDYPGPNAQALNLKVLPSIVSLSTNASTIPVIILIGAPYSGLVATALKLPVNIHTIVGMRL